MFKTPLRLVGLTAALAATGGACFSLGAAVTSTAAGPGAVSLASETEVAGPLFRFVQRSYNPGSDDSFQRTATCPVGYRAMAGGGHTSEVNLFMTDSIRGSNPRSWNVRWETEGDVPINPVDITVVALCKNLDA